MDGVLRIHGSGPGSWWWQGSGCVRATLYVGRPGNSSEVKSLEVTASSGSLTALDVGEYAVDRVKVTMRNGRVHLRDLDVRGSLHVSMSNGQINASNVRVGKALELRASNSPLDLANVTASSAITVQATNAHINAQSLRSPYATLRTSNGRVSLGDVDVGDNLLVHTSNGKIEGDARAGLFYARTSNAAVRLELGGRLRVVAVDSSNGAIDVVVGGFSGMFDVNTSNSRVSVTGTGPIEFMESGVAHKRGLSLILFTLNVTADALGSDCLLRDIQASKGYNAPSVAQNQRRSADKDDSASDDSDDDAGYATSITTIVFSPTISQISGGQPTVTVSAFVPVAANSGMQGFVNALPPMPMAPSGRPMLPFAPMVPGNPAVQPFVPMVAGTPTVGMSAAPSMQGMMAAPSMSQMPGGPMGPMVPMGSMGMGGAATYFPVQNVNLILQSSFASTSSVSGCPHSCDCSSSSSSSHGCDCSSSSSSSHGCDCCCGAMNPPSPVCSHGGNDWCCCGSPPPVSSPSCFCCCSMSSSTPSPVCPPCCCWCPMNTSSSTSSSSPLLVLLLDELFFSIAGEHAQLLVLLF
ncbi:hypothetical protein IWW57_003456 [Coemansia sp. S610]|nr:hypothetical protein IWW57_003456 [Coemansia sp. S610]